MKLITVRDANPRDIEGIAALFNSDPSYSDPWFNEPVRINTRLENLRREGWNIAQLVAVDEGSVIGFIAAEQYYLTDQNHPNGRVAEVKKVFVKPSHRGHGISSRLLGAVEAAISSEGYDFAVATAVCGHPHSQELFLGKGYMATGFAPNFINTELTHTSPRESSVYVAKAISEGGKASLQSRRTIYVPSEAIGVLCDAYVAAGLFHLREIVVDTIQQSSNADREWVNARLTAQSGGNAAMQPILPHETLDIAKMEHVSRVKAAFEAGYIPVGILPIGTDRIIMMYVPRGLMFDASKVQIAPKAKQLADTVGNLYNTCAARV